MKFFEVRKDERVIQRFYFGKSTKKYQMDTEKKAKKKADIFAAENKNYAVSKSEFTGYEFDRPKAKTEHVANQ